MATCSAVNVPPAAYGAALPLLALTPEECCRSRYDATRSNTHAAANSGRGTTQTPAATRHAMEAVKGRIMMWWHLLWTGCVHLEQLCVLCRGAADASVKNRNRIPSDRAGNKERACIFPITQPGHRVRETRLYLPPTTPRNHHRTRAPLHLSTCTGTTKTPHLSPPLTAPPAPPVRSPR